METLDNKCPACGSSIMFNSTNQMWDCTYCSSKFTLEEMHRSTNPEIVQQEANMVDQLLPEDTIGDVDLYRCKNCGAEIIAEKTTPVPFCVYCSSITISKEGLLNDSVPNYIVPFKITKEDAIKEFKKFTKGRLLIPKNFRIMDNIDNISGVYIPFWAYDLETNGEVEFEANDIKIWNDSKNKYKKVDRYSIRKSGHFDFFKVVVGASTRFPDELLKLLEPYNFNDLVSYNRAYLSGYLAEKYDISEKECLQRATRMVKDIAIDVMKKTVGHSEQKVINDGLIVSSIHTYCIMLPVWMLNIKHKDKIYKFAINGQTGKMVGNIPIGIKETIIWSIIFFVILFVIGLIFVLVIL